MNNFDFNVKINDFFSTIQIEKKNEFLIENLVQLDVEKLLVYKIDLIVVLVQF